MKAHKWVIVRIRIKRKKYQVLIRAYIADCTAIQAASIALVHRNTATRYFRFFRRVFIMAAVQERHTFSLINGIEIDESYFGPRRQRGKRGRGASHKIVVLGLLKRQGKVFTQIIPNASRKAIMPIVRRTVQSGSDIYTDGWRSYDALAIYGYNHKKVKHTENEFAVGDKHINGIESFWSWTKHRLNKYHGLTKRQFVEYLLESEYRFNHQNDLQKRLIILINTYRKS
jgi:transposase